MDELDAAQRLQLDQLREEYQRRYGVGVEFMKSEIGPGQVYANAAARALVSPNGAWFECVDQPMEFSGATGSDVIHRFVPEDEARALIGSLYRSGQLAVDSGARHFGLLALYGRAGVIDPRAAYVCDYQPHGPSRRIVEIGLFQPERLPLAFRCRMDLDMPCSSLPFKRGVVFGLCGIGERCLLVEIPYDGPDVRNLADIPPNPLKQ